MSHLRAVQPALDAYHTTYRNPKLKRLRPSNLFALFADTPNAHGIELAGTWPDVWPDVDSAGVYLFLDANLDVLYVGKASLRQTFGTRLSDWFKYEMGTGRCKVVGVWSRGPTYVVTIPVQAPFEAPSLEEYLFQELHPTDNIVGRKPERLHLKVGDIVSVQWPESRYGVVTEGTWNGRVIAADGDKITVHFEYPAYEEGDAFDEDIVIDVGKGIDEKYKEKIIVRIAAV